MAEARIRAITFDLWDTVFVDDSDEPKRADEGLAAKPIVDMMPGLRSLGDAPPVIRAMERLGYQYVADYEDELPERRYFVRPPGRGYRHKRLFHVHAVETTSAFWRRHLAFRDHLRTHPDVASEYADLKRRLATEHGSDRVGYTNAKTEFITGIESLAIPEEAD